MHVHTHTHSITTQGGVLFARHDDAAKELRELGIQVLIPSTIFYEHHISSRTVQWGVPGDRAWDVEGYAQDGDTRAKYTHLGGKLDGKGTGDGTPDGNARNLAPEETRDDVESRGFCKRGMTMVFDARIVKLDA